MAANENDAADFGARLLPGERSPAPYSAGAVTSRGRLEAETECTTRSPFQRDRDRILHSTAFRRLTYKTQVFLFHEGDHYRTRLTHSLEVAQIARTVARQLRLDEDLAEAIALAHDLGHPPFGHAGERALHKAMRDFGGFDHNAQSLRVVTALERKYVQFDGLNLTWETLEGPCQAQRTGGCRRARRQAGAPLRQLEEPRSRLLAVGRGAGCRIGRRHRLRRTRHRRRPARPLDYVGRSRRSAAGRAQPSPSWCTGGKVEEARAVYELTRRLITQMIADLVVQSRRRLADLRPRTPDDIRAAPGATAAFSPALAADVTLLKAFLFARVYRHDRVMSVMSDAERIVGDLFARYLAEPAAMAPGWYAASHGLDERRRARLIADFVAGMTDRYAIAEHRRLFDATPDLR